MKELSCTATVSLWKMEKADPEESWQQNKPNTTS